MAGGRVSVTPVQKVLEMLQGMVSKAQDQKHQEQVQYAAYKQFCDDVTVEKQRAIQQAESQINLLQASVLKHDTEAARLAEEIKGHEAEVAGWANDTQAAAAARDVERADYMAMHSNYSESIEAVGQAIRVLKQQAYDRPGVATSLLEQAQIARRLPPSAVRAIVAFLARGSEEPDLVFAPSPQPDAYEFRSHDIISLLEQLKDKFRDELTQLEKSETAHRHAYELLAQDLTASIGAGNSARELKLQSQAKHRQESAADSASLQDTTASKDDDTKDLQDLTATCQQKATDFDARQKLRADEITALQKAVEIISSTSVKGAADQHLPSLLQRWPRGRAVLAQLRSSATNPDQLRAAAFLREVSEKLGSRTLSVIAVHARDDPFAKVKKLIQDLVDRLLQEAASEADHKGWCDTEIATNTQTRETKSREVETLQVEIEGLTANIAQLQKDIATLSTEIAEITTSVANATSLRDAEKLTNAATLTDAREAQTAVSEAIRILNEFYQQAATATSFTQHSIRRKQQPPIFDATFRGQQSESGGIIAMLEVIQSDFARLESTTLADEAAAQAEFETFVQDSSVSKAQKQTDVNNKSNEQKEKEMALVERQTDLRNAEQQLAAAEAYYEKLRPSCIDAGQSYEERVQRRREEIEALKEALRILNGEDIAALEQQ